MGPQPQQIGPGPRGGTSGRGYDESTVSAPAFVRHGEHANELADALLHRGPARGGHGEHASHRQDGSTAVRHRRVGIGTDDAQQLGMPWGGGDEQPDSGTGSALAHLLRVRGEDELHRGAPARQVRISGA